MPIILTACASSCNRYSKYFLLSKTASSSTNTRRTTRQHHHNNKIYRRLFLSFSFLAATTNSFVPLINKSLYHHHHYHHINHGEENYWQRQQQQKRRIFSLAGGHQKQQNQRQHQHPVVTMKSSFSSSGGEPNDGGVAGTTDIVDGAATTVGSNSNNLSPRILETLDPCVVLMKDLIGQYSHLWDDKDGIYSLAQGVVYWEPPSSCTELLIKELTNSNSNTLHMYGPAQGIPELVDAIQTKIRGENSLTNHSVMVTTGANQAYVNTVLTLLNDSSKSIVFKPYYFNHVMAIQMCCGNDSLVVGPCDDDGIPDLNWLEDTLKSQSIDMITIVNPGNPTGVTLSKEYLQRVVNLCEEYDVWLVLDCTYEYFTLPELNHQPIATFPNSSKVIHIFSFSKSYSLAGYRCGYIVLPNDNGDNYLLSNMLKVQDTIPIGPPRISQIAALGAMQGGDGRDWVYDKYATLNKSRDIILDALKPLKTMGGSGAMYVMAKLPPRKEGQGEGEDDVVIDDVEFCRRLVEEYGIAIIPGTFCGFQGWIRVCYANLPPELCKKAAERLRDGIQSILL